MAHASKAKELGFVLSGRVMLMTTPVHATATSLAESDYPMTVPVAELRALRSLAAIPQVLLVEDNAVNQRLAMRILEKRGYPVTVANHGKEALEALAQKHFDIVLMDLQMPVMDGFEALAAIRGRERETGAHLPIVAVTANAMKGDRERCLAAGFDAYVSKPIQTSELFDTMESMIQAHRQDSPLPFASERATAIYDHEASLARVDGDEELLREMAGLFLESYPDSLHLIEDGLARGDANQVYRAAHTLKGSAANFNASTVVNAALQLEMRGKEGRLENAAVPLAALQSDLRRLAEALKQLAGRVT